MAAECAASGGQDSLSEPQVQSLLSVQRPQVSIALVWGPKTQLLLLCDVAGAGSGYSLQAGPGSPELSGLPHVA